MIVLAFFFLDYEEFLVKDPEGENKFGFSLKESLKKANNKRVFEGMGIYLSKGIIPEPEKCRDIVECGGGQILREFPTKKRDNCSRTVIVCKKEDISNRVTKAKKNFVEVVDVEWILSGVVKQELDFKSFSL